MKSEKADIVFTNTLIPFVGALVAYYIHLPHIWWIHEFGEEHFGFKIGWGNQKWAFTKMKQWSKLIIGNSNAITQYFKLRIPGCDIKRLYQTVPWNGPLYNESIKIADYLMFGVISKSKAHLEVLAAIIKLKERRQFVPTLHIKGPCDDKEYLNELIQLIKQHDLQNNILIETGFFKKEDIIPKYRVLIVASNFEGFGRVIVEANKAGVRTIVKNNGGMPELINKTNGIVYNNLEELIKILNGEIPLPVLNIQQNYNEVDEINKLKYWLQLI
jgi:glycosyltransferase involved in cell wall biosynthesis